MLYFLITRIANLCNHHIIGSNCINNLCDKVMSINNLDSIKDI